MAIPQPVKKLRAWNRTPITHQYFFPDGIIATLIPDGKFRLGANGLSFIGGSEGAATYLREGLPQRVENLHLFEELFAGTGIEPPKHNLDDILLMGSYNISPETARRLADDYSSVDVLVMLSDKLIGKDEEIRVTLAAEFTNLEFYWLPKRQQQEITDKIMAEIGSKSEVLEMFQILFGSFVPGGDNVKYVSGLLADAGIYIKNPDAFDPMWKLFFTILEHDAPNTWAFLSGDQQGLRARARKRVDSIDTKSLDYFLGMKPEQVQRFGVPDYTFSEALKYVKEKAPVEPFRSVLSVIADLYFRRIARPTESAKAQTLDRAMNKLAYFALRNAIPLEQLGDKLQGDPPAVAINIHDYNPSRFRDSNSIFSRIRRY